MDEKEHKILSEISKNSEASQRHLSKIADLSLGMVNIVLHRLIEKGHMKIKQLDGRKVQYLLTPKGFSEKLKKSQQYLQSTISKLSSIKESVKSIALKEYDSGKRKFIISGSGDLSHLVEIALKEIGKTDISYSHSDSIKDAPKDTVLFFVNGIPSGASQNGAKIIDLQKELSEILV